FCAQAMLALAIAAAASAPAATRVIFRSMMSSHILSAPWPRPPRRTAIRTPHGRALFRRAAVPLGPGEARAWDKIRLGPHATFQGPLPLSSTCCTRLKHDRPDYSAAGLGRPRLSSPALRRGRQLQRRDQGRGQEAISTIGDHRTAILMHNDAVVQGLSEAPFMQDVRRWGVLTIGTGLANARFSNHEAPKAKKKT